MEVDLELPPKLIPVFSGKADVRGAYGGRGSAKTRSFAKMTAVRALMFAAAGIGGIILCGREIQNSLDDSSLAEVKAAIASEPWLADAFDVGEKAVRTKCGRVSYVFQGFHRNLDSIKSKARILIAWVDEAEPVSETAWAKLIPTLREEESELWVTWNPERVASATNKRFRKDPPDNAKIVEINWRDNPWFPERLNRTRLEDKAKRPDDYEHVWEGGYKVNFKGAYFASQLADAKKAKRFVRLSADPLLSIRSYHDIGGAGAKADAYAIWITQFVDQEIRVLDYYESQGQSLSFHVDWLRSNGWEKAQVILPHDGANANAVSGKRYRDHWEDAGFDVRVVPNQGQGAAMQRIEAVRREFPRMWFNEAALETHGGLEVLRGYQENYDEKRDVGLGPLHNWASHGADAFGLMAMDYKPPHASARQVDEIKKALASVRGSSHMGS
jgi:phage terminase large subunit